MGSLPPLDMHAHADQGGALPTDADARVFAQTFTPEDWDAASASAGRPGLVWGLGLHPIVVDTEAALDAFLARLPRCEAVGEVGLDYTGLSPIPSETQRSMFAAILADPATADRIVSIHALLAFADVVAMLADHPVPGAVIHWYGEPGEVLRRVVDQRIHVSVNDAVVADPRQARVIADLPPELVLVETDAPYIERGTGQPLNPWEDTELERLRGRALRAGEVLPVERSLAAAWGVEPDEVRWRLWTNLAALESEVRMRPFGAAEVVASAGGVGPVG